MHDKKQLLSISQKVNKAQPLTPHEISSLLTFQKKEDDAPFIVMLKNLAMPLSLVFGFSLAVFSGFFDPLIESLPGWTKLSPSMLAGFDYLWSILGTPVERESIVYHLPNLFLYSFGIIGLKELVDRLERQSWVDKVLDAQQKLKEQVETGELSLKMKKGHSVLFVGSGDFIGTQFVLNHKEDQAVTIANIPQHYTKIWNKYDINSVYDDLKSVISRSDGGSIGEYFFFPVKDNSIFLPNETDFDLPPHKLDILCQNIRVIEKENKWKVRPIMIVGDRFHSSFVQSEHSAGVVPNSQDTISLASIAKKYPSVQVFDPTDIVLKRIIEIAKGRQIVFRATKEGIQEYKKRFYKRLKLLGYAPKNKKMLTIGYDLFEDQTEQQTLAKKIQDYYPIVLSKNVRDALIRNGYKKEQFIYVPDLVLKTISEAAAQQ